MKRFLFLLAFSIILFSCIFGPDNEDFSFKISVVDPQGNPVEGLNVSLVNKLNSSMWGEFQWPIRAQTTIPFSVPTESFVEMYIENIKENRVRSLISEEKDAGYHSVLWNGTDDDDNFLVSGIYYSKLKLIKNDTLYYYAEGTMYLISISENHKNGVTDADGIFYCTNKNPFINLFSVNSLQIIDEDGNLLGLEAFSDTTAIYLFDANHENHKFEYVIAKNGENEFEIVWDPEILERTQGNMKSKTINRDAGGSIIPDDIEIEELYNYPNPFN
ncbi:MAG: FlgD immunoglobulin-like domain containing protein [Candidatus Cloacimonadota bacterium]|nr:FlgD immunoglobulin-like domain containing protein [Candidatus Cloacimonadota bacterium]